MVSAWCDFLELWLAVALLLCIGLLAGGIGWKFKSKIIFYTGVVFCSFAVIAYIGAASFNH